MPDFKPLHRLRPLGTGARQHLVIGAAGEHPWLETEIAAGMAKTPTRFMNERSEAAGVVKALGARSESAGRRANSALSTRREHAR